MNPNLNEKSNKKEIKNQSKSELIGFDSELAKNQVKMADEIKKALGIKESTMTFAEELMKWLTGGAEDGNKQEN